MKIRIVNERKDYMEALITEEDISIVDTLSDYLNMIDGVEYAGHRLEHPLTGEVTLIVKTNEKITPREAVRKAFQKMKEELRRLEEEIYKL